ncbi:MAG: hypothetical protein H6Q99_4029 [Proteobacteria bacterium]|nr:hypothetical protein [Pseudomonadota bacterium]
MARFNRPSGNPDALLPPGDYEAHVVESEVVPTASGRGEMLKLTFEVTAGAHKGRRVTERLNIVNANAAAQRIAQQALGRLCAAAGLAGIDDSEALHFIPVVIRVAIRPGSGDYGDQTTIKTYRPSPAGPARRPAQPPPRASDGRRPWDQ